MTSIHQEEPYPAIQAPCLGRQWWETHTLNACIGPGVDGKGVRLSTRGRIYRQIISLLLSWGSHASPRWVQQTMKSALYKSSLLSVTVPMFFPIVPLIVSSLTHCPVWPGGRLWWQMWQSCLCQVDPGSDWVVSAARSSQRTPIATHTHNKKGNLPTWNTNKTQLLANMEINPLSSHLNSLPLKFRQIQKGENPFLFEY